MKEIAFGLTYGALDAFDVSHTGVAASGWIVSLESNPVTELRLSLDGIPFGDAHRTFLPSPDVAHAWPALRGIDRCRFVLHSPLDDDQRRRIAQHEVVSITPWIGDRPGVPLERIFPLMYPAASPEESTQVGAGEFVETSFSFLALFRLLAGLERDESVLDAGCGLGRMAFGLAHYLGPGGRYEGFDVSKNLVESAARRFASRDNFRFRHADVLNPMYNPRGRIKAEKFAFPYGDGAFTFAFATSVFTHMLADDVRNYLREIRRTLRPQGRCVATFFCIDADAQTHLDEGHSTIHFRHRLRDGCIVANRLHAENAVAYREEQLHTMIEEAGLRTVQFHRGQWPGRTRFLSYQDVLVLSPA